MSLREELAAPPPERLPLPDALDRAYRRAGPARAFLLAYAAVVALQFLFGIGVELVVPSLPYEVFNRIDLVGLALQGGLFIGSAVTLVRWNLTSYRLLPDLKGSGTNYTPGWAGWAYFVPFINIVRPHTIMRELWEGSAPARVDLEHEPNGGRLMGVWWGCWLLGGFANRYGRSLERRGTAPDDSTLLFLDIGSAVLLTVAAVCAALLIGRIDSRMRQRGTEVLAAAVHPTGPPPLLF